MIPISSDLKSLIQNPRKNKSYLQHNKRNQNKKRKEKEKNAHEFFDDSLVNKDGNSNAEDSDKSKITTSPTKIVLKIFSSRSPFFYEFVLWCFHSTSHFCTLFISLSSPNSRVEDLLLASAMLQRGLQCTHFLRWIWIWIWIWWWNLDSL